MPFHATPAHAQPPIDELGVVQYNIKLEKKKKKKKNAQVGTDRCENSGIRCLYN